jgi:hypothetical protein
LEKESLSSNDDDDSDLDFSSDNGDSSEAEQGCLSTASIANGNPFQVALSSKSHQWQGADEERWLGSGCEVRLAG